MTYKEHCTCDFTREISNKHIVLWLAKCQNKKFHVSSEDVFGPHTHLLSSFLLAQFNLNLLACTN